MKTMKKILTVGLVVIFMTVLGSCSLQKSTTYPVNNKYKIEKNDAYDKKYCNSKKGHRGVNKSKYKR